MALLEITGVSKAFGSLTVADRVSLSVAAGEAVGIIGPNGAGKSTLFNLVAGNLAVDAGSIRLDGRDMTRDSARRRARLGLGRTFQIPQPFGKLSVFENLLVAATCGGGPSAPADISAILERTGLLGRANALAGTLSLLERKRLELARALATAPKVLLLDETAGGLTDGEAAALVATIREVHASGVAIVWIEHVLHALTAVVSRILVLNFGKVIAEGPPGTVMAQREVREIYLGIEI